MSRMNERGTVPKLLSRLTCREWKNVARCRNHCPYWHVGNERTWHGAETTVHTDMSGMKERGTVPKPLSILTCREWKNVAPCRNHCPYWHVGNERTWHGAGTTVHTDMSGMKERGTVPKPLSILTCQEWTSVALCRNHCPYWQWEISEQCEPRGTVLTSVWCTMPAPQLVSVRILLGNQRVGLFHTEHIPVTVCWHPVRFTVYGLGVHTGFDKVLLPNATKINMKNHETPNCKGPFTFSECESEIFPWCLNFYDRKER